MAQHEDIGKIRDEVKADFNDLTPIIYSSLSVAQQTAPECLKTILVNCGFKDGEYPIELGDKLNKIKRQFKAHLYRAIVQIILQSKGVSTKAVKETENKQNVDDWERNILSNNGLAGEYLKRHYKILKGIWVPIFDETIGEYVQKICIPSAGFSKAKRMYFRQSHRLQFMLDLMLEGNSTLPKYNAVYLWDDPTPNILNLYLACPKWCDDYRTEAYFIEQIQHPLLTMKPEIPLNEIIENIDLPRIELELGLDLTKSDLENKNHSDETHEGELDESDEEDNL